jgi:hypothetical protein
MEMCFYESLKLKVSLINNSKTHHKLKVMIIITEIIFLQLNNYLNLFSKNLFFSLFTQMIDIINRFKFFKLQIMIENKSTEQ